MMGFSSTFNSFPDSSGAQVEGASGAAGALFQFLSGFQRLMDIRGSIRLYIFQFLSGFQGYVDTNSKTVTISAFNSFPDSSLHNSSSG